MAINILMPALSPTMTEGKLAKWHVKVGDAVKSGQVMCEIETDKATMEVEAVDEGKIGQIVVPEGTEGVKVNAVIAILLEEGENGMCPRAAAPAPTTAPKSAPAAAVPAPKPAAPAPAPAAQPPVAQPTTTPAATSTGGAHLRLTARQAHRGRQGAQSVADQRQWTGWTHRQGRCRAGQSLAQRQRRLPRQRRRRPSRRSRSSRRRATRVSRTPRSAR